MLVKLLSPACVVVHKGIITVFSLFRDVTKNCGVTTVTWKIHESANFISNLLAYLISVASQCIFSCLCLLL